MYKENWKLKQKNCKICGNLFYKTGTAQVYCGKVKTKNGCAFLQRKKRDKKYVKNDRGKIKNQVLGHYSPNLECICCKTKGLSFLTLDHINDDGAQFRGKKQTFTGTAFYHWVKRNNFPKNLQVLCYNCNNAKHWNNNICPHKLI